jgi:hypothetical protein
MWYVNECCKQMVCAQQRAQGECSSSEHAAFMLLLLILHVSATNKQTDAPQTHCL